MLPTLSFTGSGQSTQLLLHETAAEAELRGDRGDLPGVVGLVAADRHRVSAPCAITSGTMYSSLRILLPP